MSSTSAKPISIQSFAKGGIAMGTVDLFFLCETIRNNSFPVWVGDFVSRSRKDFHREDATLATTASAGEGTED